MKIAIVAPSPVPFGAGGAEKMWWGMLEHFNKKTTHQCELIKIPIQENNFWNLIDAYYSFHNLDVSCFDMVITGKYPGWMVHHDNHQLYMLHCLRGLYDIYPFKVEPLGVSHEHPGVDRVLKYLDKKDTTVAQMFELLFELKDDASVPVEFYGFPGPFIREIIHFFDQKAMSRVRNFFAISHTVSNRVDYFPENAPVKVIYPPSILSGFKNRSSKYFFTVSRLDDLKRVEMIIKAYLLTKTDIPLKIAGTGHLSESLKQLAKHDKRIEFLGFVTDRDLVEYYANAFAVVFIPFDEDYGLVTIEAMMCENPVLTFTDSGGVLEFVEHGKTGLVCSPDVHGLAANIEYLAQNPEICRTMGKNARKKVQSITWDQSMEVFLAKCMGGKGWSGFKKLTVVSTYPVYPPRGGGQNRIFYLCRELAKTMAVELVCMDSEFNEYRRQQIAPGLWEVRVPKTLDHDKQETKMRLKTGIPIRDIAMLSLADMAPEFLDAIKRSARDAAYIISCQPYVFALLKQNFSTPIIHDSQNVEYLLKKQMLGSDSYAKSLLGRVFEAEKRACSEALMTTVCAMDDADTMAKLYGFDRSRAVLVPNGVNLDNVVFTPIPEKLRLKETMGLSGQKIVLFIGSWHKPNIEAVETIFKLAENTPAFRYIIMGSVHGHFEHLEKPENVGFTGIVDDLEKSLCLALADVAVNPMETGSGTNLKMLDYMAAGIPVVSTPMGARGLDIPDGCIVECEIDRFAHFVEHVELYVDLEKARDHARDNFGWETIAKQFQVALLQNRL